MDEAAGLLARLDALTPREERLLRELCLTGSTLPALAAQLGISDRAAAIQLVRAAAAFAGGEPLARALSRGAEDAAAARLLRGEPLPEPLGHALTPLRANADRIQVLTQARMDARERRLGPWRWVAAAVLVALAWALSRAR